MITLKKIIETCGKAEIYKGDRWMPVTEVVQLKFDHDLEISFNSRYLIDIASQLDGEKVEIYFNDSGSPALIKDPGDFDSIFVVMPMKG